MRNENSNFQPGAGVFDCIGCHRRTRGNRDSAQLDMCEDCFELAGLDNQINDDGRALDRDEVRERDERLANIVRLGGDADRVRSLNDYLWPANPLLTSEPFQVDWLEVLA